MRYRTEEGIASLHCVPFATTGSEEGVASLHDVPFVTTTTHTTTLVAWIVSASVTCSVVAPSHTDGVTTRNGTLSWSNVTYFVLLESGGWIGYRFSEPDFSLL